MCSGLKPPQWKPHITIARLKGNSRTDSLNHLPTALTHWTPLTIAPQALSLIESQLTPTGPEYQTLQSWPLTCASIG
jgi:2'-5' RNA ligase